MKAINYLLIATLLIGGCGSVFGDDLKKPSFLYYVSASVEELLPLAKGGNAEAQGILACMYMLGEGVPQDQQKGIKLFQLSAAQGNSESQWLLGATYLLGKGVP